MKTLLCALALTTALTIPALARPVTLTTNMNTYGGDGAYLAFYVTDAQGTYRGSLWMAGASRNITRISATGIARRKATRPKSTASPAPVSARVGS